MRKTPHGARLLAADSRRIGNGAGQEKCKFWNEAGQILPFFLLIECFCNGEKADRNGAEEIAHPQSNHKEITSFISKFTAAE